MARVCYDAGHYANYNTSPANKAYNEAKRMWDLHLLVKKYTEQLGVEVITTRDNQEKDLALSARGKKAEGCDAFISYHSNAVDSKVHDDVDYVVAYVMCNDKQLSCDDDARVLAQKLVDVTAEVMGTTQKPRITERLSENDKDHDGVKDDNYYGVLAGARTVEVAALILENSFHTNTRMTNWLLDDNNLDKLARRQAEVIASHVLKREVKLPTSGAEAGQASSDRYVVGQHVEWGTSYKDPKLPCGIQNAKGGSGHGIIKAIVAGQAKYQMDTGVYCNDGDIKGLYKAPVTSNTTASTSGKKSNDVIADEVIAGKWGNGDDRKAKLKAAGYDYSAIQPIVNAKLKGTYKPTASTNTSKPAATTQSKPAAQPKPAAPAKKSVDEIANEVINGKWGNGTDREAKLTAAGYNYSEVQAAVNKKLGVKTSTASKSAAQPAPTPATPARKSNEEIAREVINGKWGNGEARKQKLAAAGYDYSAIQKIVNKML